MKKLIAFVMVLATFGVLYVTAGTFAELDKDASLKNSVESGKTLVMFHATWCSACAATKPHLRKLAKEHDDIKILKIDIDKHKELANQHGVQGVPTMKLFIDGKQVGKEHVGSLNYDQLVAKVADDFK